MIFDHREGRGDKKDLGIQNSQEEQGEWELELDHITQKPDTVNPFSSFGCLRLNPSKDLCTIFHRAQ